MLFFFQTDAGNPDWYTLRVKWGVDVSKSFYTQPRTVDEAKQQGYRLIGPDKCGASKAYNGFAYIKGDDPIVTLLFDKNDYIAGIQTAIRVSEEQKTGFPPKSLRPPFVLDGKDNDRYVISAYFTDPSKICTEGRSKEQFEEEGTGENLWIQTGSSPSEVMKVAKNQDEISAPWVEGECFPTMGHHYWYNSTADMDCDELLPVFLLYNGGKLNGFGFVSLADMDSTYYEHPEFKDIKLASFSLAIAALSASFLPKLIIFYVSRLARKLSSSVSRSLNFSFCLNPYAFVLCP
ncbi:hypothetical protein PoB_000581600 [Plakobranchus ocellatus]|uniref:Uncharacterized protein n=1 Tax=Plakobranchus ocellatus TaxID=259542 RepID=A0AAV3XWF1_9GAST|nr:hypothetical protein PoB_000581600 [Plakobranchus ocellatus]